MTDDPELTYTSDDMLDEPQEYNEADVVLDGDTPLTDLTDPWQGMEVRQRGDKTAESEPQNASLSPDDAGAESDLPRPSRSEKQRLRRRTQFSTVVPALLLIGFGLVALLRPELITRMIIAEVIAGTIFMSILLRFLFNSRRERGLFFIGALIVISAGIVALVVLDFIDFAELWPVVIIAPGLAMILTFIFERSHDRGLLLPGLMLIVAGVALLLFTMGFLDSSILPGIALYWPVLFLLLALALLPRAIRDRVQ
ncbi:MAG: hypothetical protein ABI947_11605 [Chloroflexota bacterium]